MDPGAPGTIGLAVVKGSVIVLSLLIVAYPFYRVVSMWIERTLEASEALFYLGTLTMLLLGVIAAWGTPLGVLLLLALILSCLGLPLLNRLADKLALRRMEDEDIREFSATLLHQPKNTYFRERLARIFLARKQWDLALAEVEQALEVTPKDRNLERLRDRIATEQRRTVGHLKVCPKCFHEASAEAGACASCGHRFVDPSDFLRLLWTAPALQAACWGGPTMLFASMLLMVLHANFALVTLLGFFGVAFCFWYIYVLLTRRY